MIHEMLLRRGRHLPALTGVLLLAGFPAAALAQTPPVGGPPPPPGAMAPPAPPAKRVPGPPGVAATVNGQKITKTQVENLAYQSVGTQALDQLIVNTLVEQQAKKEKVVVTPAEINARLAQIKQQIGQRYPGMTLSAVLNQRNQTLADLTSLVKLQVTAEKLVSKSLPPLTLVHVRHILVLTKNPNNDPTLKPHTDAEAKAIIDKAQADLKAGKSFADVAKQYSEDPGTKDKGGDDGWISQETGYIPEFKTAALALKAGESTVINTPEYGYFLINGVATGTSATGAEKSAYETALAAARQQQTSQALQGYITTLRQKAKVQTYYAP